MPEITQFSPRGKPGRPDEVELKVDQYEALKIADYQGYNQEEGAKFMGISRPSFGRILREGRKTLVEALVKGKIIRIRIGNIQVGVKQRNLPLKSEIEAGQKQEEIIRETILRYPQPSQKRGKSSLKSKSK